MTFTEFMEKIEELNIKFHIRQVSTNDRSFIHMVRDDEGQCPICAVCNRIHPFANYTNSAYHIAGERIGLAPGLVNDIVTAADDEIISPQYINDTYRIIRGLIGEK